MAGKYDKQLAKYNDILSKKPNDPHALAILARIAIKENRIADAENYYTAILLKMHNHPESLYMMGFINMKRNKRSTAINYFKKLLENGKENVFIYEYFNNWFWCKRIYNGKVVFQI